MKGKRYMKILKIDKNKAEYSLDGKSFNSIVNIGKEDLKTIIDYIMENDDAEFDEINGESNKINNKAEEIIYSDLYTKFSDLNSNKNDIIKEINDKFSTLIDKYELE
jgi:hypothetical protein